MKLIQFIKKQGRTFPNNNPYTVLEVKFFSKVAIGLLYPLPLTASKPRFRYYFFGIIHPIPDWKPPIKKQFMIRVLWFGIAVLLEEEKE